MRLFGILFALAVAGCADGKRVVFTWEPVNAPAEVNGLMHGAMPPGGVSVGVLFDEARQLDCATARASDQEIAILAVVDASGGAGDYVLIGEASDGAVIISTAQWRWEARAPSGSKLAICAIPVVRK